MDKKKEKLKRQKARQERREEIVADYHHSKLTQREYAKAKGVGLSTLQLWIRLARENANLAQEKKSPPQNPKGGSGFIEAGILEPEPIRSSADIEVTLSDGTRLSFGSQLSTEKIVQITQSLRGTCSH